MTEVELTLVIDGVETPVVVEAEVFPALPGTFYRDAGLPPEPAYAEDLRVTNYAGVAVTDLLTEAQIERCAEVLCNLEE